MKMKKFLAFVLAGVLSLSNAMWATAKTPEPAAGGEREMRAEDTASPSDAWQEIVYTDVTFDSGRADSEITWEDYKKTIFCGGEFEARIRNHGSSELDLSLKVASPAGTVKTSPCGSVNGNQECTVKIEEGRFFPIAGVYEISLVDYYDEDKAYGTPISVEVKKIPSMTICLTKKVFTDVYYQEILSIDRIFYDQYDLVKAADGVSVSGLALTNVTAVCEKMAGTDIYVIKEMRSDQCDSISVEDNEYARPVIKESTLEGFDLKQKEVSVYEGESIALEPVITGKADESQIVWESSDDKTAFVENGTVTGLAAGTAVITAKLQGLEAVCKVTVKKTVQRISLKAVETDFNAGRVYQMTVTVEPEDMFEAVMKDIRWSSNNEEVAEVDQNGRVTTKKPGSSVIRAQLGQVYAEGVIRVIEAHPLEVRITADGYEKAITLTGKDALTERNYFEEGKEPESLELKPLPDELKKYFDQEPTLQGKTVKFRLKPSEEEFQIDIPISMKGQMYTEYNNDCVLRIFGRPFVKVAVRTEEDIREFFRANPFRDGDQQRDTWDIEPVPTQDVAGKLNASTVENALNSLNFVRYVAGIPADVENSEKFEELSQTGVAVLMQRGKEVGKEELTHTPQKPAGVSEEFYQRGYIGTGSSNLALGYRSLVNAVISGWMDDGTTENIAGVGHRRWCLNPYMKETGFGHAGDYTAMYTKPENDQASTSGYTFIPWPGQYMPVEYFEGPWSVCLNRLVYNSKMTENISVTMTYQGKEYVLSESNKDIGGKYFSFSPTETGLGPAVIFKPDIEFHAGDKVDVKITGLKDAYGNELPVEYSVNFFSMDMEAPESIVLDAEKKEVTVNSRFTLKAFTVQPDGSKVPAENVKWSSSNSRVATVDEKGEVRAVSVGIATITAEVDSKTAMCLVTVKKGSSGSGGSGGGSGSGGSGGGSGSGGSGGGSGSSGSGGGSGSGGSGGGSSGKGSPNTNGPSVPPGNTSLPSYVIRGTWSQVNGMWQFTDDSGLLYKNRWAAVVNPYANTAAGQDGFDWFFFDADGNMQTGWHLDVDGNYYYLNPASDGTRGRMMTGWVWIPDAAGVNKCYYLNPASDGTRGKMMSNTVVEGYTINQEGQWTVNGVPQSR